MTSHPTAAAAPEGAARRAPRVDPRRERTRSKLRAAARLVFERDGFHNAKLSDISATAGVASGTLYLYYHSKHEIFADVMHDVLLELRELPPGHVRGQEDPVARLIEVNRVYLTAFRRNARLMALLRELGNEDRALAEIWAQIAQLFQDRAATAIRAWQRAGIADPALDPKHAAHALTFMVERLALAWASDPDCYEDETLIETVNTIWVRALGLPTGPLHGAVPPDVRSPT